jgi:nicotinamide riboside transporter PnuC
MINWDFIAQIGVTVFGVTAIILVSRNNRWGFVIGLISQPFWLLTSFINKQWGVFFLTVIYVFSWSYGIYQQFYKKENK